MYSVEICAGGGGQALGIEQAGFEHLALVEIDNAACSTLKANRPTWNIIEGDLAEFSGMNYKGINLLAGGVPCPPFSKAGRQLGENDERNLFPEAIRLVDEIRPQAVMLENVRGLLDAVFDEYRTRVIGDLEKLGYHAEWRLLNASDYGVPQLRPRVFFVAVKNDISEYFTWPKPIERNPLTVGQVLYDLMSANGWTGINRWSLRANDIAPTIVGGSKKHGGPDLGPTRAKKAWASLGVDGRGIADSAPNSDFVGMPRLTCRMVARLQSFPDEWSFVGKKTPVYRQIGNALPPPLAKSVGEQISQCINIAAKNRLRGGIGIGYPNRGRKKGIS
ncbi:MAG: DNA cytosine methyltransferase [Syntrophomonadaceae bacterium]|nr:DNA cytosine methyltransferase [Syntrophomonadaceae bacterium]